jgi:hypothetical protein
MSKQDFARAVQFVNGWGNFSFDVSCGNVLQHVDGCACLKCSKSFERGQKVAVVQIVGASKVDPYHFGCLPQQFYAW